jgi:hypothetical protein
MSPVLAPNTPLFQREALAAQLVRKIQDAASASGIFLAAPRRTGKSTFIREDLRPALKQAGFEVIYADLWEDKQADPADVITASIKQAILRQNGLISKAARATGLKEISLGGFKLNLDQIGLGKEVTLSVALKCLSTEIKKPIALLIDEAQHAAATPAGENALFALKAARDDLNSSGSYGLRIVATGSNQDKLAALVNGKDRAFFGAPLVEFPRLDLAYIEWFCNIHKDIVQLDAKQCYAAFQQSNHMPELLTSAMADIHANLMMPPTPELFFTKLAERMQMLTTEVRERIQALTNIQRSVLMVIAANGRNFAPFTAETLEQYAKNMRKLSGDPSAAITEGAAQQALIALQEQGLIWKPARGIYQIEDPQTIALILPQA